MISSDSYEEVYEILSYMDKATVMKIPEDILSFINNHRNVDFKTRINKNDIFNEQNVSSETIDLLCWLDYNYWMNKEKKMQIDKINRLKFQKDEEEKNKKYNPNNLFKKRNSNSSN